MRVGVSPDGFELAGEVQPWWSGELHYWRVAPQRWPAALDALVELGFCQVSTYVPWEVHEQSDGDFDFTGNLDVGRFLRLAADRGLGAIVRPGPDCGAELPGSGWPRRILDDPHCRALRPDGTPYLLLMATAHGCPPSYASRRFRAEVGRWYDAVTAELAPLQWPDGPILAVQVDNEHGYHFQANSFVMDHHPDAVARWHARLASTHGTIEECNRALGERWPSFDAIPAPTSADDGSSRSRRLAWVEFREQLRVEVLSELSAELRARGMDRVLSFHNDYPRTTTPMHLSRLEHDGAVDVSAADMYLPRSAAPVATELARRLAGSSRLPVVAETGGGWLALPWLLPATTEPEDPDTLLPRLLGAGVRGINIYMAVERDRWFGSPIDRHGDIRRGWDLPYRRVSQWIRRHLHRWTRDVTVLLVDNRAQERLAAAEDLAGDGVPCFHQLAPVDATATFGSDPAASAAARWLDDVAAALAGRHVDVDRCTDLPARLDRYELIVMGCAGTADPNVVAALARAPRLRLGPQAPTGVDLARLGVEGADVRVVADASEIAAEVTAPIGATGDLQLHRWRLGGRTRLVVGSNSGAAQQATLTGVGAAVDVETGENLTVSGDAVDVELGPWQVRLIEVEVSS